MKRAAKYIRDNSNHIIEVWEKTVNAEMQVSDDTHNIVLRNQLPNVLEDLSEIIEENGASASSTSRKDLLDIVDDSSDHGRHRAATSNYSVAAILKEYRLLHEVLTDLLRENDIYDEETGLILNKAIETAMVNSAKTFNRSLNDMKEKLMATLAHDIRNPVSSAFMALDMLDPEAGAEEITHIKEVIENSLGYAIRLIEGLLDTITVEAGEGITLNFKEQDILDDIDWVVKEASMIFPNKISLETKASELTGVFDGTAIRRILENLVSNAVKYGSRSEPVHIYAEDKKDEVVIRVHNEGNPIPDGRKKEIFNFLNGEEAPKDGLKSWGMGLSLVKAVTDAHGGKLELKSDKEFGTEFKITLGKYDKEPGKTKSRINYK
ncbi:sensor histidine kinase [Robertkochia aurantiaca]|uniref:sensor histidine kinase n=1 Tax=Robertkochia aurantiaca TaxID=2873700 RepID=UPI001CCB7901|nr:HAMP domain-containing sensor histidine kinase [Robertkochia sp. 3YJGBD-33]